MTTEEKCQCEHVIHTSSQGCENLGTVRVSPSYLICSDCELTMGFACENYLQVSDQGIYAGMAWHVHNI